MKGCQLLDQGNTERGAGVRTAGKQGTIYCSRERAVEGEREGERRVELSIPARHSVMTCLDSGNGSVQFGESMDVPDLGVDR